MAHDVVVVTGIGGIGTACARRLGPGRRLVIADFAADKLAAQADALTVDGFDVVAQPVDVTDEKSVAALAAMAGELGFVRTIVHTAGISPTMASGARVFDVDLIGTEHVLDAFLPVVGEGTVAVCIASMAGYFSGLSRDVENTLATCAGDALADAIGVPLEELTPQAGYCIAKRGVQLRVERAALEWGRRGARVVSVSPGIIATAMGRQEVEAQPGIAQGVTVAPMPRFGTADDIAAAVDWLVSPAASFVTGCDLRVDGGTVATMRGTVAP